VFLGVVVSIFQRLQLHINWAKGKTEAILVYRGRNASKKLESRRLEDGGLGISVQTARGEQTLHIVAEYKHLGGIVAADGNPVHECRARASAAMAAYAPISGVFFGASGVSVKIKLFFAQMLIWTGLLYNIHTLVMDQAALSHLNKVYMRVLRRIAGKQRYQSENNTTDVQVRRLLSAPSIDCVIVKQRLLYIARLARKQPRALSALLQAQVKDSRGNKANLKWTTQARRDLKVIYERVVIHSEVLLPEPSSAHAAESWNRFMCEFPKRWEELVQSLHFAESVLDKHDKGDSLLQVKPFMCSLCTGVAFATQKALWQHERTKHGLRNPMRRLIRDGVCPSCLTNFQSRIRCLAHVSDCRRTRCRDAIMSMPITPLTEGEMQALDEYDRQERRRGWIEGHSHPIAVKSARTVDGKQIGRVTR